MQLVRIRGTQVRKQVSRARGGAAWLRSAPLCFLAILVSVLVLLTVSQIAVIHRNVLAQIQQATQRTSVPSRLAHLRQIPPQVQPQPLPQPALRSASSHARTGDQFKIEPLLVRNAPSVELYTQLVLNEAHARHLTQLLEDERNKRSQLAQLVKSHMKDCATVPPGLAGKVFVNSNHSDVFSLEEVLEQNPKVGNGGQWKPPDCNSRHRVAIVVPYRDRWQHLLNLLAHLHPLMQRQQLNYRIYVVEQAGNDTFNKGAVMNAGFLLALRDSTYHCFVFHDVDLMPEDDRIMYSCPSQPRHLSVAVNELGYRLPYKVLVGGVFSIRTEHFFRVNGYSNMYWGWGGEDDDMGYRVQQSGLSITRPPEWLARYTMMKHVKRRPLVWTVRNKLLRTSGRRYRLDGLNTLRFRLIFAHKDILFTHLMVDVGHPPANIRHLQDGTQTPPSS